MNIQRNAPDYSAIKAKQNLAWASGDYAVVGTTLQIVGENLAEALNLVPGAQVLDVAAGNGNATLAFARRWHHVTSTDYVQALLDKSAARAWAEALDVRYQVADAEALPFADGSFDAAVSTFGVMFSPNQTRAARELLRVTRDGGQIGLANWTPGSFVGQLLRTIGDFVPAPFGIASPVLWGHQDWLMDTFSGVKSVKIRKRQFIFRYRDPEHFISVFRTLYGPVHKAFAALDPAEQTALHEAIGDLIARYNTEIDGSVRIPGDYAEVVIMK